MSPPKASAKAPAKATHLGTKRACSKCSAKFYDFGKSEIDCPKCGAEVDLSKPAPPPAPVKSTPVAREAEAADTEVAAPSSDFESLDDLDSDDDGIVEDLAEDTSDSDEDY